MTLDEAIKHAEEVAKDNINYANLLWNTKEKARLEESASEQRQLAEWLKELKDYRERIPSYEAGYNDAKREIALSGEYERAYERGKADAQPKMGHWIEHFDESDKWYECDQCHTDWGGSVNYCPNCGAKMAESEEDK